jgi:hypothetical protein
MAAHLHPNHLSPFHDTPNVLLLSPCVGLVLFQLANHVDKEEVSGSWFSVRSCVLA